MEQGEQETKHHHIYVAFNNKKSFLQIKKLFPTAHIDTVRGTPGQVRDYCSKPTGKYEGKTTTQLLEPTEWGILPSQGKRSDLAEIILRLEDGGTPRDIRIEYPAQYIQYKSNILSTYQEIIQEKYMSEFRFVNVVYLSDTTGVGKTRYLAEKYGYENIYRVSDYKHPFDSYNSQDVIVFEEFRNDIPLKEMLQYLDGHPCMLRARYSNKVACYTKIYIVSNWPFNKIYDYHQYHDIESYKAFERRIHFKGNLEAVEEYDAQLELPLEDKKIYRDAIDIFGDLVEVKNLP